MAMATNFPAKPKHEVVKKHAFDSLDEAEIYFQFQLTPTMSLKTREVNDFEQPFT